MLLDHPTRDLARAGYCGGVGQRCCFLMPPSVLPNRSASFSSDSVIRSPSSATSTYDDGPSKTISMWISVAVAAALPVSDAGESSDELARDVAHGASQATRLGLDIEWSRRLAGLPVEFRWTSGGARTRLQCGIRRTSTNAPVPYPKVDYVLDHVLQRHVLPQVNRCPPHRHGSASLRASRSAVPGELVLHQARLFFGMTPWLGHACQKHPSTKTANRAAGRTMSGVPGRSRRWMRNLRPGVCRARRSATSRFVEARGILVMRCETPASLGAGPPRRCLPACGGSFGSTGMHQLPICRRRFLSSPRAMRDRPLPQRVVSARRLRRGPVP